jgi:hypothetical protein
MREPPLITPLLVKILGPLPNFSCADAVEVPIQTIFDGFFFFYKDLAR